MTEKERKNQYQKEWVKKNPLGKNPPRDYDFREAFDFVIRT